MHSAMHYALLPLGQIMRAPSSTLWSRSFTRRHHHAQHRPHPHHPHRQPAAARRPHRDDPRRQQARQSVDEAAFQARVARPWSRDAEAGRRRHRRRQRRRGGQAQLRHLREGPPHRLRGRAPHARSDIQGEAARLPRVHRAPHGHDGDDPRAARPATARSPGRTSRRSSATSPTSRRAADKAKPEGVHDRRIARRRRLLPGQRVLPERRRVPRGARQRHEGRVRGDLPRPASCCSSTAPTWR